MSSLATRIAAVVDALFPRKKKKRRRRKDETFRPRVVERKTKKTTGKNAKPREKIRRLPQNSPLFLFDESNDREKKQR